MTLVTARPDATLSNSFSVVSAASAHAALSDDGDASYLVRSSGAPSVLVGCNEPALPAGAVPKSLALRVRSAINGGSLLFGISTQGGAPVSVGTISPSWGSPTTTTQHTGALTAWPTDLRVYSADASGGATVRLYEVFVDLTYVAQPEVAVDAPSGTVSDTNMPEVSWVNTLDSDGGAQVAYEVKVFAEAVFTDGGFDPATSSPAWTSGIITSAEAVEAVDTPLADDDYRTYVRVAQIVNGNLHWSDWEYSEFTIDVALPAVPSVTVTPLPASGSFFIDVDLQEDGTTSTDMIEIQRSVDLTSWVPVRTFDSGDGLRAIDPEDETKQLQDWEAPILTTVYYRVRALHDYSGVYASSAWADLVAATLSSRQWWLKDPLLPSRNVAVELDSYPSVQRPARAGVFQALGSTTQIVVSDTRQAERGTVSFRLDTTDAHDELLELLETSATLLLHGPATDHERDRYVRLTDIDSTRLVDKGFVEGRRVTVPWFEVARPAGPLQENV